MAQWFTRDLQYKFYSMRRYLVLVISFFLVFACKEHAPDLSGEAKVTIETFEQAFQELQLPLRIYDTSLEKLGDTSTISYTAMTGILPDSVLQQIKKTKEQKVSFHAIGKKVTSTLSYYLLQMHKEKNSFLVVLVFTIENKFATYKELLQKKNTDGYAHNVYITTEPAFIISREKTGKNNSNLYSRNSYAYSAASKAFILVMKDSNETPESQAVIDPIDTLPQKNKYSGNYVENSRNFISVRDGKDANTYQFFIHFEKNNGDCTGELKGIMKIIGEQHAVYQENNDACVIDFRFEGREVVVKERGNCGNHRGIKCFFDDTYTRKKS